MRETVGIDIFVSNQGHCHSEPSEESFFIKQDPSPRFRKTVPKVFVGETCGLPNVISFIICEICYGMKNCGKIDITILVSN